VQDQCSEGPHFAVELTAIDDALLREAVEVFHQYLQIVTVVTQLGLQLDQLPHQLAIQLGISVFLAGTPTLTPLTPHFQTFLF